jgi:hypothetical protein
MRSKELWVFLFCIGSVAISWPFLAIFGHDLPGYLFAVWFLLIAAIFLFIGMHAKEDDGG